jgi:hypothetical protein
VDDSDPAADGGAKSAAAGDAVDQTAPAETIGDAAARRYVFRGDDSYRNGAIGRALGAEADAADIQDFAEHILRKEPNRTSRYVSFTQDVKVARRFTTACDNRFVRKADLAALRALEAQGEIRVWGPDQVEAGLARGPRKLAKRAADVRAAMVRNSEILIEGQIPGGVLTTTN